MADLEHFKRYGWSCNEANLNTLPPTAPKAAKDLAKWLTLEGRRSSLAEWLGVLAEDRRIHGKFWNIGAWTQRMSHSKPNSANIPAILDREPTTAVEEVKYKYNGAMRECFTVPEGSWLVGTDADGIQLRILTHYMKSEDYREAILKGDKDLGTDIHSVNKKSLGPICKGRDEAKTFIYAWLLGAGLPKIGNILDCTVPQAKRAEQDFLTAIPDLDRLKKSTIPRDARRGYFIGLDGRKVQWDKEHGMLAGYLQCGEAVVMKMAALKWVRWARQAGLKFKFVNFVHDEWQVEVEGSHMEATYLGYLQCKAIEEVGVELDLFCPLAGSTKIGKNWKETH